MRSGKKDIERAVAVALPRLQYRVIAPHNHHKNTILQTRTAKRWLAELFIAALDDKNREDQVNFESDLDRLFGMLEEKDASHVAFKRYCEFKNLRGKKVIIQSCYNRLYPVCSTAKCTNEQKTFYYFSNSDCDIAADSLITNFKERDATKEEKELIQKLLSYSLDKANSDTSLLQILCDTMEKIQIDIPDERKYRELIRFGKFDKQLRKNVFLLLERAVKFIKGCG